jgi:hypothetical protein
MYQGIEMLFKYIFFTYFLPSPLVASVKFLPF